MTVRSVGAPLLDAILEVAAKLPALTDSSACLQQLVENIRERGVAVHPVVKSAPRIDAERRMLVEYGRCAAAAAYAGARSASQADLTQAAEVILQALKEAGFAETAVAVLNLKEELRRLTFGPMLALHAADELARLRAKFGVHAATSTVEAAVAAIGLDARGASLARIALRRSDLTDHLLTRLAQAHRTELARRLLGLRSGQSAPGAAPGHPRMALDEPAQTLLDTDQDEGWTWLASKLRHRSRQRLLGAILAPPNRALVLAPIRTGNDRGLLAFVSIDLVEGGDRLHLDDDPGIGLDARGREAIDRALAWASDLLHREMPDAWTATTNRQVKLRLSGLLMDRLDTGASLAVAVTIAAIAKIAGLEVAPVAITGTVGDSRSGRIDEVSGLEQKLRGLQAWNRDCAAAGRTDVLATPVTRVLVPAGRSADHAREHWRTIRQTATPTHELEIVPVHTLDDVVHHVLNVPWAAARHAWRDQVTLARTARSRAPGGRWAEAIADAAGVRLADLAPGLRTTLRGALGRRGARLGLTVPWRLECGEPGRGMPPSLLEPLAVAVAACLAATEHDPLFIPARARARPKPHHTARRRARRWVPTPLPVLVPAWSLASPAELARATLEARLGQPDVDAGRLNAALDRGHIIFIVYGVAAAEPEALRAWLDELTRRAPSCSVLVLAAEGAWQPPPDVPLSPLTRWRSTAFGDARPAPSDPPALDVSPIWVRPWAGATPIDLLAHLRSDSPTDGAPTDRAAPGRRVLLVGPPASGKSGLLRRLASGARTSGDVIPVVVPWDTIAASSDAQDGLARLSRALGCPATLTARVAAHTTGLLLMIDEDGAAPGPGLSVGAPAPPPAPTEPLSERRARLVRWIATLDPAHTVVVAARAGLPGDGIEAQLAAAGFEVVEPMSRAEATATSNDRDGEAPSDRAAERVRAGLEHVAWLRRHEEGRGLSTTISLDAMLSTTRLLAAMLDAAGAEAVPVEQAVEGLARVISGRAGVGLPPFPGWWPTDRASGEPRGQADRSGSTDLGGLRCLVEDLLEGPFLTVRHGRVGLTPGVTVDSLRFRRPDGWRPLDRARLDRAVAGDISALPPVLWWSACPFAPAEGPDEDHLQELALVLTKAGDWFYGGRFPVTTSAFAIVEQAGGIDRLVPRAAAERRQGLEYARRSRLGRRALLLPVTYVTPPEAADFAATVGLRLPSHDEWMLIATDGTGDSRRYPWGNTLKCERLTHNGERVAPVDACTWQLRLQAGSTIYDLVGNVRELVTHPGQTMEWAWCGSTYLDSSPSSLALRARPLSRRTVGRSFRNDTLGFRLVAGPRDIEAAVAAGRVFEPGPDARMLELP